jgi:von Willebrand factor type A domain/Aerotolerance regulator N-terminal
MSFAAPVFLLAVLAGVIPVVLHMIHHKKAVQLRFSTLQFLRVSVQRTRRRKYFDDLALMLVRSTILVVLALGLARPALTSLKALLGRGSKAVVVVLDNSASMATLDGGQPRFQSARRAAEQILDQLREGDAVALLPTGGPPGSEYGKLFHTHETVRQALEQCQLSHERADLAGKLQQARQLLSEAEAAVREIYVISDNQTLSWQGLSSEPAGEGSGGPDDPAHQSPVVVVNLNRDSAPNVALKNLQLESPALTVGVPIQVQVEVHNTSTIAQQKHLELHVDGTKEATSPTLNLPPGAMLKHEFRFAVDRGGIHRGEVRLAEEDGCAADNRLFFALTVNQQIPVAIVKSRKQEIAYIEDSFYLERALASDDGNGWAIRLRTLTAGQLASEPLSGFAVIFCVNLPGPDQAAGERLRSYVVSGGHLFWICGPNVEPAVYNAVHERVGGQLLPVPLGELRDKAANKNESWHIGQLDKDYPPLGPLIEPASLYQSVLVHKHFALKWAPETAGRVLARLNDGQPLLVERGVGSGSILMLGTSAHVEWTNLPLRQLFLPLFARLTFHLAGAEKDRSQIQAGAPLVIPLRGRNQSVEVEIVRPSGVTLRVRSEGDGNQTVRYADTHEVGIYQVRVIDPQQLEQYAFAVNPDPGESDPACLTAEELKSRFGKQPVLICDGVDDLAGIITKLREGTSLWTLFLSIVLLALVLEAFLANHLAGAKEAPVKKDQG